MVVINKHVCMQGDHVNERFVPNFEQRFNNFEGAYEFYRDYALLSGFPIKKNRTRGEGQDICCSFEGKHNPKVGDEERQREKTSKRDGCKAMVCANKKKGVRNSCTHGYC